MTIDHAGQQFLHAACQEITTRYEAPPAAQKYLKKLHKLLACTEGDLHALLPTRLWHQDITTYTNPPQTYPTHHSDILRPCAHFIAEASPLLTACASAKQIRHLISQWVHYAKQYLGTYDDVLIILQGWELRWMTRSGMADLAYKRYRILNPRAQHLWGLHDPRYWMLRIDAIEACEQALSLRRALHMARKTLRDITSTSGNMEHAQKLCAQYIHGYERLLNSA